MSDELSTDTDLYEVLGVDSRVTPDELKSVYRRLARQYHPDANVDAATTSKFQHISQAYFVLSNPERRAEYDKKGTLFTKEYRAWGEPLDDLPIVSMEEMIPGSESATTEEIAESAAPRNWDFLLSTLLIVILIGQTILFVVLGFTYGLQVLLCSDVGADCNYPVINWSARVVVFGTPLIAITAIVIAIVRLVRRKHAWWIVLAAMVLNFGIYVISNWLVDQAVPL